MPAKDPKQKKLSRREELFCQYYMDLADATSAYRQAGYAPVGAKQGALRLLTRPKIQERLAVIVPRRYNTVVAREIGERQARLDGYDSRRNKLLQIIAERAMEHDANLADRRRIQSEIAAVVMAQGGKCGAAAMAEVDGKLKELHSELSRLPDPGAGGSTGLLTRSVKAIGAGKFTRFVDEYRVDTALLRELRELEKQAAIEQGQWSEKREIEFKGQLDVRAVTLAAALTPDELLEIERKIAAAAIAALPAAAE